MRNGKYVIVHVDDSLLAREMVREALTQAGFEVHSAENAQDFEQRLMADPYLRPEVDFIVLDMEMPDLMGAQVGAVMDAVFEELKDVPFLIYSAKDREFVESRVREVAVGSEAYERNYKGYLGKSPDGAAALAATVAALLPSLPTREKKS
jgi:DNA-binding response OmpR family regulator